LGFRLCLQLLRLIVDQIICAFGVSQLLSIGNEQVML
jgi:hypothetical protein